MKNCICKLLRCEQLSFDRSNGVKKEQGSWKSLRKELKERTLEPFGHFSFVAYFLIAIFSVSGAGVWLEIYNFFLVQPGALKSTASLRTSIVTFIPALASSATLQVIWAESSPKFLRAFAALILFILTVVALAIAPTEAVSGEMALSVGGIAAFIALWMWWIVNAKQEDFLDPLDPDAPIGNKSPDKKLLGSLDGFNS